MKHVKLDDLRLNFLKNDSTANYDFLFRPSASPVTKEKSMGTDYARQAHRLLDWLYERMPDNGHITRLHVTEQHNHHRVSAWGDAVDAAEVGGSLKRLGCASIFIWI